jgi:Skp family chaperone for outer membrane proteins
MALNFDAFQRVVEAAQQADAVKADLKRALRKVSGAVQALRGALREMETALADDYVATPRQRKPQTPRTVEESADDTPRNKPGRSKKLA